jgi:MYXO-CTERM domain-containing protein
MRFRLLVPVLLVLVVATLAGPEAKACSIDPTVYFVPDTTAPRNAVPFGYAYPGQFEELALVQTGSGELIDVTLETRGELLVLLVPDTLLEPGGRYEVVSNDPGDIIESGFVVTDEVDQTPPPRLVIAGGGHRYSDGENSCAGNFSGVRIDVEQTGEPGYVELQASVVRRKLSDAPLAYDTNEVRPKGFDRGDTVHVRARWRDAAGNAGDWSKVERIETPSDCGCATPSRPARAPWVGAVALLGMVGLLVRRRMS